MKCFEYLGPDSLRFRPVRPQFMYYVWEQNNREPDEPYTNI